MKIPDTVRIGGVDYSVIETEHLNDGSNVCYGRIDYQKSIIELNPDNQDHLKKCLTLWREIIHGIIEHANMNIRERNEEGTVDSIAKGIHQVLQDNVRNLFDLRGEQDGDP